MKIIRSYFFSNAFKYENIEPTKDNLVKLKEQYEKVTGLAVVDDIITDFDMIEEIGNFVESNNFKSPDQHSSFKAGPIASDYFRFISITKAFEAREIGDEVFYVDSDMVFSDKAKEFFKGKLGNDKPKMKTMCISSLSANGSRISGYVEHWFNGIFQTNMAAAYLMLHCIEYILFEDDSNIDEKLKNDLNSFLIRMKNRQKVPWGLIGTRLMEFLVKTGRLEIIQDNSMTSVVLGTYTNKFIRENTKLDVNVLLNHIDTANTANNRNYDLDIVMTNTGFNRVYLLDFK